MTRIKKECVKDYKKVVVTQDDMDRLMNDDDFKFSASPIKIKRRMSNGQ